MSEGDDQVVREALCRRLQPRGAARELAAQLGVTPAYLSHMKTGTRPVSLAVAQLLGFQRVTRWEPVLGGPSDPS